MVANSFSYLRMRDWEFDLYKVNEAYISNRGWCYLFFTHKFGELKKEVYKFSARECYFIVVVLYDGFFFLG